MKTLLFCCLFFLLASCGKKKTDFHSFDRISDHSNSECAIIIDRNNLPAITAVKAFRMQNECKLKDEDELISKLKEI